MKFIINSLLFSKQIQSLSGVLTNNNTVPIINCFLFHLDDGMLTIRATDLETTLISKIEVETGNIDGITDMQSDINTFVCSFPSVFISRGDLTGMWDTVTV